MDENYCELIGKLLFDNDERLAGGIAGLSLGCLGKINKKSAAVVQAALDF